MTVPLTQIDSNESRPIDGETVYKRSPEQRRILNEVHLLMQRNQTHKSGHFSSSANHNSSTRKETDNIGNKRGIMPLVDVRISSEIEVEMKRISDSVGTIQDPGILYGELISETNETEMDANQTIKLQPSSVNTIIQTTLESAENFEKNVLGQSSRGLYCTKVLCEDLMSMDSKRKNLNTIAEKLGIRIKTEGKVQKGADIIGKSEQSLVTKVSGRENVAENENSKKYGCIRKHRLKKRNDFSDRNPTKIQRVRLVTEKRKSIGGIYDHNLPLHARPPELPNVLHKSK